MISQAFSKAAKKIRQIMAAKPKDWHSRSFSRKIAWRCRNPDPAIAYTRWVDKFLVKNVVTDFFHVAETYLAVSDPTKVETKNLPNTFVMKATHGWNMSLLVEDGVVKGGNRTNDSLNHKFDTEFLQETAVKWFNSEEEKKRRKRQKHYAQLKPGIIIEEFLNPIDYELQLFLFDGHFRFALVLFREFHHSTVSHQMYDEKWNLLEPGSEEFDNFYQHTKGRVAPPPLDLLEKLHNLCEAIDHVRADFFVCGGKYYFSEFTFTHNGGMGAGFIGKYDAELGLFWRN